MSEREIEVVLAVSFEAIGRYRIDLADYDEWRGDLSDTPERVQAYLEADGDGGWDVQSEVYEEARKRDAHRDIIDSHITAVRFIDLGGVA